MGLHLLSLTKPWSVLSAIGKIGFAQFCTFGGSQLWTIIYNCKLSLSTFTSYCTIQAVLCELSIPHPLVYFLVPTIVHIYCSSDCADWRWVKLQNANIKLCASTDSYLKPNKNINEKPRHIPVGDLFSKISCSLSILTSLEPRIKCSIWENYNISQWLGGWRIGHHIQHWKIVLECHGAHIGTLMVPLERGSSQRPFLRGREPKLCAGKQEKGKSYWNFQHFF